MTMIKRDSAGFGVHFWRNPMGWVRSPCVSPFYTIAKHHWSFISASLSTMKHHQIIICPSWLVEHIVKAPIRGYGICRWYGAKTGWVKGWTTPLSLYGWSHGPSTTLAPSPNSLRVPGGPADPRKPFSCQPPSASQRSSLPLGWTGLATEKQPFTAGFPMFLRVFPDKTCWGSISRLAYQRISIN